MKTILEDAYEGKPNPRLRGVRIKRELFYVHAPDHDYYGMEQDSYYTVKLWNGVGEYAIGDLSFRIDGTRVSGARFRGEPVSRGNVRYVLDLFHCGSIRLNGFRTGSVSVVFREPRSGADRQLREILANMEEVLFEHLVRHRNWKSLCNHGVLELDKHGENL